MIMIIKINITIERTVMKKSVVVIQTFLFIFIFSRITFAYRPFSTEDAGVAGKNVFQLELSRDVTSWKTQQEDQIFLFVPVLGLSERMEASVEIPYVTTQLQGNSQESGVGDINAVVKYLMINGKTSQFTLKSLLKLDNGDYARGLGSGDKDAHISFVFSKNFNKLSFHAQAGFTFVGRKKNPNLQDIKIYGLAMDACLSEKLHGVLEFSGNEHADKTAPSAHVSTFMLGVTYKASNKAVMDAGVRVGVTEASPKMNVSVGTSLSF